MLLHLNHQIILGTQYNLPFGFSRSWYFRYEQPTSYDNRMIVDTQVHHQIWRIESTLNINNVFNSLTSMSRSTGNEMIGYINVDGGEISNPKIQSLGPLLELEKIIQRHKIEEAILGIRNKEGSK